MKRALVVALAVVLTGCAAPAPTPEATEPASSIATSSAREGERYVHLGDSYAAGVGVSPLVADSPLMCLRSQRNYGQLVATRRGWALTDVSCGGADTTNLTTAQYEGVGPQLDAVGSATRVVTMTLGGNDDEVFATAVGECTRLGRGEPDGDPCRTALSALLFRQVDTGTRPALEAGLRRLRERAPDAQVLITGYPWLLPKTGGCFAEISVAPGDVPFLRELQRRLNAAIAGAARATGATYVDLAKLSDGHDACAGAERWVEPMGSGPGSMHPNAAGQRALADAVDAALTER